MTLGKVVGVVLAISALGAGCGGGSAAPPNPPPPTVTEPPPTEPAHPPAPTAPPSATLHVTAPACGYGGSAPAVSAFLDVRADSALHGVTATFEVRRPGTTVRIAGPSGPVQLSVPASAHSLLDFSTQGSTPFGGDLTAGRDTRLQFFAGMPEGPAGEATPMDTIEIVVTLTAGDGTTATASCTTGSMWPSS